MPLPSAQPTNTTEPTRPRLLARLRQRLFTPSNRTLVLVIIIAAWVMIIGLGKLLPWASALTLLFAIMFGYFTLVSIRLWRGHSKPQPTALHPDDLPHISIVVAAHNEAAVIGALLKNLLALNYPRYDICIMDDRSTDGTAAIAQTIADSPAVQQAQEKGLTALQVVSRAAHTTPGKSAVLNEALGLTQGELIAVFDADAQVPQDFLIQMAAYFIDDCVGAVQARKVVSNPATNLLTRTQYFEMAMDSYIQTGRDSIGGAAELRGNGQVVRRSAVMAVGGWNDHSLTDDLDLSTRFHLSGWEIRFAATTPVFEEAIPRLAALYRQRRRWAEGSLVRYLEYAPSVLTANNVSLRAKADLVAYIIEFLFPLWLLIDYTYLVIGSIIGDPHTIHILSSLMLLPVLGLFFYGLLMAALRRFEPTIPWFSALWWAGATAVYLVTVWVPVTLWVVLKLLLRGDPEFDWGKTDHHGLAVAD